MEVEKQENSKIVDRQNKSKTLIIEELKKTPIVEIVCKKIGIGRATYYRWCKDDTAFADQAFEALMGGKLLVNDMAESQLISAIKDQNMTAIIFWLKANHPSYASKVEISGRIKSENTPLTLEQEQAIMKAIELTNLHSQALTNNEK